MGRLGRVDPAVSLAVAPLALPLGLVLEVIKHTCSVLLVVLPLADKLVATGPNLSATAIHLSAFELTLVN